MIVGTAGHIDHGKTTLVKALTGTDADRLAEEKARGITIELGFAYADLGAGAVTGFVDVPGHEKFVHTMLAGAGGIDLALLVVAADDGIMPQTREHLAILDLLGIDRGIVAVTKSDLADEARIAELRDQIAKLLAPTGLSNAPITAVSTLTGEGVPALRQMLAEAERGIQARAASGRFRLVVDRAFTLAGAGTVVTGTVVSGTVSVGDQVLVSPTGLSARVRGIHAQNHKAQQGVAGQRCALNLSGDGVTRDAISRGDVVLEPLLHQPTARLDVELSILSSEARPIGTWFPARLHLGAAEVGARIVPLQGDVAPGGQCIAQLVLDRSIETRYGDRFILRDVSARRTIGGGRVLDLHPPARKRTRPERLLVLSAMQSTRPAEALAALADSPLGVVDLQQFATDRALTQAASQQAAAGLVILDGRHGLSAGRSKALRQDLQAQLAAFHAENPDLQGVGRERMRLQLQPRLPKDAFLALLRDEVAAGRLVLDGAFLRLPGHQPRLSPEDEAIFAQIAPQLVGEGRFRPPRTRDFAQAMGVDEGEVRHILRMAARQGRVDQIAHDHFFAREVTAEMARIVCDIAAQSEDGWFTAPAFRDRVQNGRKVAIEILDFFDRNGLTLRRGDLRRINPHRIDLFGKDGAKG